MLNNHTIVTHYAFPHSNANVLVLDYQQLLIINKALWHELCAIIEPL